MKYVTVVLVVAMLFVSGCGTMQGACRDISWLANEAANNINAGE